MHRVVSCRELFLGYVSFSAHSLYKSCSVSKVEGYGLWFCRMKRGTAGRKKAWIKRYEILVTQFVSVFVVKFKWAVLVAGGL